MTAPLNYALEPARRGAPWWLWTLATLTLLGGSFYFLVPFKVTSRSGQALAIAALNDVELLGVALALFKDDTGRFPTAEEGLSALNLPRGLEGWRGPYIKKYAPRDPWGYAYVYVPPTGSSPPKVLSVGPDGIAGTADDIVAATP